MEKVVAQLNAEWRVRYDPRAWVLERNPRRVDGTWDCVRFCASKAALIRDIRREARLEPPAAILALPDWHPAYPQRQKISRSKRDLPAPATSLPAPNKMRASGAPLPV